MNKANMNAHASIDAAIPSQDWMSELEHAVTHTDEAAIWHVMQEQALNDEAHEALANMVSRMAYTYQGVQVCSEIFMMPVVAEPGCDMTGMDAAWKLASERIKESLREWFGRAYRVTVFNGVQPMDWVTTWTPTILRNHLLAMSPDTRPEKTEFVTETIQLPKEAPTLGFVVIGLSRNRLWPELPDVDSLRDARFKSVVRHSLQLCLPSGVSALAEPPTVLTPERAQYAITDGISLWLNRMHETVGITGWVVSPAITNRDVVFVTLALDNEMPFSQFSLRLHQIGMQGLNEIIAMLSSFAPCMDAPHDIEKANHRLPLKKSPLAH